MKKSGIVLATFVLALVVSGCSNQKESNNVKETPVNEVTQGSKVLKDYTYLNKEIISVEDTEKLFKEGNINLVMLELVKSDFNRLQQKYPTYYNIDNDKTKVLKVYVFASENERVKARAEYDKKTATMNMTYHEIYEAKNIMVFLSAGVPPNEYYQRISSLVRKINSN